MLAPVLLAVILGAQPSACHVVVALSASVSTSGVQGCADEAAVLADQLQSLGISSSTCCSLLLSDV
jgi:hypothetical protein